MRIQFRHADPSSRIPPFLQARTIENVTWQLKLLGIFIVCTLGKAAWEDYQRRQFKKKYGVTPYYK